jgi:hypothetical protein
MPKLDWIGKQYVVNHTDEVPFRLLERVPEASMGEDRVTNEDSRYKESLGNDWAALDPGRRYFKMVTKGNMQSTLREVGEL